jgi:hypothetical protein
VKRLGRNLISLILRGKHKRICSKALKKFECIKWVVGRYAGEKEKEMSNFMMVIPPLLHVEIPPQNFITRPLLRFLFIRCFS